MSGVENAGDAAGEQALAMEPLPLSSLECEDQLARSPTFSPPVYRQRYEAVINYVNQVQAKTVLDMGCAECKLLMLLARSSRCSSVTQLAGVDIERSLLERKRSFIRPLTFDYLSPRENPLTISLYAGSIAEPDRRFVDWDVVSCIEIIEHLDENVLADVPEAVFGCLRPRSVLISTPNADFNVLFTTLAAGAFRHPDHRFEWCRSEFEAWCEAIGKKYSYTVHFKGIGAGPSGTEHLGCCSQLAVFEALACQGGLCQSREKLSSRPCHSERLNADVSQADVTSPAVERRVLTQSEHSADMGAVHFTHSKAHLSHKELTRGVSHEGDSENVAKQTRLHWVSYTPIAEAVYPFKPLVPRAEKVLNEMTYCFYKLLREAKESGDSRDCWLNDSGTQWSIRIGALVWQNPLLNLDCSADELCELLSSKEDGYFGLSLSADGTAVCCENVNQSSYGDSGSDDSESSLGEGPCYSENIAIEETAESWD